MPITLFKRLRHTHITLTSCTYTQHMPYTLTHTPLRAHAHAELWVPSALWQCAPWPVGHAALPVGLGICCIKIRHGGDVPHLNVCLKYKYFCQTQASLKRVGIFA